MKVIKVTVEVIDTDKQVTSLERTVYEDTREYRFTVPWADAKQESKDIFGVLRAAGYEQW